MLCALCVGQASALEYTMEAPDDYLFGRPTSDDTIYEWEDPNVDRSKNTALIPPGFGTPTSYLPGSGDPLTPNLIPGALDGGGLVSQTGSVNYPVIDTGNGSSSGQNVGYTAVTSDLYYSGGHLGTLKIPAIGLSTKVYEGTDSSTLAKGAGHFPGTSIWDGNCCIAGHNRGVRDDFGDLHTLEPGDSITWTTKLGTRTYHVVSVEKVLETDTSDTASTTDNRITLGSPITPIHALVRSCSLPPGFSPFLLPGKNPLSVGLVPHLLSGRDFLTVSGLVCLSVCLGLILPALIPAVSFRPLLFQFREEYVFDKVRNDIVLAGHRGGIYQGIKPPQLFKLFFGKGHICSPFLASGGQSAGLSSDFPQIIPGSLHRIK